MTTKRLLHIIVLALLLPLLACSEKHAGEPDVPGRQPENPDNPDNPGGSDDPGVTKSRTILVYMVASNDLGQRNFDADDIEEMQRGMAALGDNADKCRLMVYHAAAADSPKLKEIDTAGKITGIKTYDTSTPSVSIARMREVIDDVKSEAEADSYGLIFWSHGSGWIDESAVYSDPDARPLSFGYDNGRRMKVTSLGQALEGHRFDFIYFDCCLMGTVEVAYELRKSADRIVAIGTELPLEGMPYDDNIPLLFTTDDDAPTRAARSTYDYYCSPEASQNYVAIGVYRTDRLEALAEATRTVMATGKLVGSNYKGVPYFRSWVTATGAYDMTHYIHELSVSDEMTRNWDAAFSDVVVYHAATPTSYGLDMSQFSGMGCNVFTSNTDKRLGYGYRSLQWYRDVVLAHPSIY